MNNLSSCPHCGFAENAAGASSCQHRHQALPDANASSSPPSLPAADVSMMTASPQPQPTVQNVGRPMTMSGHNLDFDERTLAEAAASDGTGSGALLAVALLQLVAGGILFLAASPVAGIDPQTLRFTGGFIAAIGIVFFVLYIWSHRQPVPATVTGLVLYLLIHAGDAMVNPAALTRGLIFKAIIVIILCRSISSAMKYRTENDPRARPATY